MRIEAVINIARDGKAGREYRLVPVVHPGYGVEKRYLLRREGSEYVLSQLKEPRDDGRRQVCSCPDSVCHRRRCKHLVFARAFGLFEQLLEPCDLDQGLGADCGVDPQDEALEIDTPELVGAT